MPRQKKCASCRKKFESCYQWHIYCSKRCGSRERQKRLRIRAKAFTAKEGGR